MARKKRSEAENAVEPVKKSAPKKKREAAAKPESEKTAKPVKRSKPRKKPESQIKPEPVQTIEPEQPGEPERPLNFQRPVVQQPPPEVSQNLMAGAGLCTFVGSVLFSFALSSGLSKAMSLLAIVAAAIGLAGYLQLILIVTRAKILVLLREHLFAWFVLITVIISSVIFGIQLSDFAQSRSRPSGPVSDALPTPTPVPAEDNSMQVLPDGRVLLVGVTPAYLSGLPRRYATSEVEQMMRPYWRKWIRLEGVVKDINNDKSESGADVARLIIEGAGAPAPVSITYFSNPNQIERLRQLKKRAPVKVMCQISRRYSAGDFSFENCELVD